MRAVILDVDGTLVDSVDLHARAWQEAFAAFGHQVAFEAVRSQIGKGGDQLMPVFLTPEQLEAQGEKLEAFRSRHFKERYLPQVRAFPKVRSLVERLIADGWKVALASSAKGDELQTYKDRCEISDLLDAETSSDDAEKSKPYPDIFQAALHRLGAAPQDAIVIGDSPYDAQASRKAGVRAVGFRSGGFPDADLAAAGFLAPLYDSAADLLARYDQSVFAQH